MELSEIAKLLGSAGGKASAGKLSKAQRVERAKKAVAARKWRPKKS